MKQLTHEEINQARSAVRNWQQVVVLADRYGINPGPARKHFETIAGLSGDTLAYALGQLMIEEKKSNDR